jgi:hypothetical protein
MVLLSNGVDSYMWLRIFSENCFLKIPVLPLGDGLMSFQYFYDSSAISLPIVLIFEVDRDIGEAVLWKTFLLSCSCF